MIQPDTQIPATIPDTTSETTSATTVTREHLRLLWDNAPFPVWVQVDLHIVYINPAGIRTLGAVSEDQILGRSPLDFVLELDHPEVERRQRAALLDHRHSELEPLRFLRIDGHSFVAQEVVWPLLLEGARAVQSTFYDLTLLRAKDAALARVQKDQTQILESIPQLVWTALPSGAYDYFNRRWYDYTGRLPGETDGGRWADILHPDDVEREREVWRHSLATGDDYRIEYRLRSAAGGYKWFLARAHALLDEQGNVARWFGTCTDIDEQRQADERLRQSEERFRTAARAISDLIWTNDASGYMRGEQPGWSAFTGQSREEYQGLGWTAAVHPDDVEHTVTIWNQAVAEKKMFICEHRVRRHDGVYRLFSIRALPVLTQDGAVREWVGVHTDITERRAHLEEIRRLNAELEERVRQRTAELEASNRELEAFSYSVSHDLRAPLRTIDGFSLALDEDAGPDLPQECRGYIGRIRQGVQRMGGLIDSLLQLSRVTRAELQRSDLDLTALAEDVAEQLQRQHSGRQIDVRIEPGLQTNADPRLLQVALENLLGNAFKFTARQPDAIIEFGAEALPSGATEYFIRDNGAGFDMQYADKLFTAFQRLHGDKDFQGSGIGLATVDRIIRRHGGLIRAQGHPGRGATFRFTLG